MVMKLYDAVIKMISQRYALGIITNGAKDTIREKLTRLGLGDLFPRGRCYRFFRCWSG